MARTFPGDFTSKLVLSSGLPSVSRPITMMCWFKAASGSLANTMTMFWWGDFSETALRNQYMLRLRGDTEGSNPSEVEFICADSSSSSGAVSGATYTTAETWAFAAAVARATGTNNTCLLNTSGFPGGGSNLTPNSGVVDRITIGFDDDLQVAPWDGAIAEVAIWNAELTQTELAKLYNDKLSPLFMRPQSLSYYAPLIGNEDRNVFSGTLNVVGSLGTDRHLQIIRPGAAFALT